MKATGGLEIELRLQIPPEHLAAVESAFATARTRALDLQAAYFDTADGRLAAAGHVLRLRREDGTWVQALKSRGDGLVARPEHEVVLGALRRRPRPDPARHAGTPEGDAVAALLADGAPLVERLRTEIRRRQRAVRSGGGVVEVVLDRGRIVAAGAVLAVAEVEFELRRGPVDALLALAERWVLRHRLWLDVRTKSERGALLAQGRNTAPPRKAAAVAWRPPASAGQAFGAMLNESLQHLLPNAAALAAGRSTPEHLHQARVALRRLRSALRVFGRWSADPALAAQLEDAWRRPAQRLGLARDADVLAAFDLPPLPPHEAPEDPGIVVCDEGFTLLALRTLGLALAPASGRAPGAQSLARGWKMVAAGARTFAADQDAARHRTRRRLKRLRYATEFLLPLLPPARAKHALAAMGAALDALGDFHDVVVALEMLGRFAGGDVRIAAARSALAQRRDTLVERSARALGRLLDHEGFWR